MFKPLSLCKADSSQLLIIDIQQRLFDVMPKYDRQALSKNASILLKAANALSIPITLSEQYPKGLGDTIPELKQALDNTPCEKTSFSCCQSSSFEYNLVTEHKRPQIIICGMETHICVLQTAADLQTWGYDVYIVEDAVISRTEINKQNAIERMRSNRINITNTESVLFEWIRDASHPEFKMLSKLIL
jgi:nicotinamidase-related amidase